MTDIYGIPTVWVFNGARSNFPSGVFTTREVAETWISKHGLTGTLTRYPLDQGAFDWSVDHGYFKPKRDDQRTAEFIAQFAGGQEHYHYEGGETNA
jgi:hypothetical protein